MATNGLNATAPIYTSMATVATASEATVYTPTATNRGILNAILISVDTAGLYTFKDTTAPGGTVNQTFGPFYVAATAAPITISFVPSGTSGILLGARMGASNTVGTIGSAALVGNVLTCTGPGSSHVNGMLITFEE